jgi:hypothetical protein
MQSHPHFAPESVLLADHSVPTPAAVPCPILAAAKALKKLRKQERLRFFTGWCASLHALGFSF